MVGVTGGSFIWSGGGGNPASGGGTTPHGAAPASGGGGGGVVKQTLTSRTREARAGKTRNGPRGPGAVLEKVLGITAEKNVSIKIVDFCTRKWVS